MSKRLLQIGPDSGSGSGEWEKIVYEGSNLSGRLWNQIFRGIQL